MFSTALTDEKPTVYVIRRSRGAVGTQNVHYVTCEGLDVSLLLDPQHSLLFSFSSLNQLHSAIVCQSIKERGALPFTPADEKLFLIMDYIV